MTDLSEKKKVASIVRAIATMNTGLQPEDTTNIASLLDVGEVEVAFELLCTQLYEYDARLSTLDIYRLSECGRILDAEPKYVRRILEMFQTQSDQGSS